MVSRIAICRQQFEIIYFSFKIILCATQKQAESMFSGGLSCERLCFSALPIPQKLDFLTWICP
jgi:hypothetical protein